MLNAVKWAQQTGQTQQTIVARELFTAWFGIRFDGTGALLAESNTAWTVVTEHITRLQSLITNGGAYQAWKSPANLFCGDFGEPFGWDTVMFDSAGRQLNSLATVEDIYHDWASYIGGSQVPYYVPSLNNYYLLSPTTFSADTMCSDTSGLQGLNSFGNSDSLKSIPRDGLNYPVYREALSDFVLICPNVLGASTASDSSAGNILLSDIGTLTVTADLVDRPQLSFVKPMSTVILHEILHMVTRWDVTTAGTISGQNMIVDHSYNMMDCLSMALSPWIVTQDGSTVTKYAYQNTENYVHFALAWWYYNSKTVGTDTPATFYAGFLQKWDHS
ncbi:uncharacterized protein N7518_009427 [Penicillium psychrosexuale]|uniref:uncharacterized protein n=1 Tax=Penicillium psychrosexuale TaxID=1002107 RepID=UPI0025457719|nr:uncharacterized protein N7518_009427 [Penicillium psychrosexuale]KAJ5783750.1 hypothetical protein N7518_009427 [Penicillium psychrosexuale]